MNLYAYVNNDPVNFTDPTGLIDQIIVTGSRKNYCGPGSSCFADIMAAFSQPTLRNSFGGGGGPGAGPGDVGPAPGEKEGEGEEERIFRKTCFVVQGGLSAGAQFGVERARVGFGEASLFGDAGTAQLSFGTRGANVFSTQGFRAGLVAIAPGLTSNNMVGAGIEVSREGTGSQSPRPGTTLYEQPFTVTPFANPADSLVFGFGGAIILGVSLEVGVEFVGRGQSCPTVGGPK